MDDLLRAGDHEVLRKLTNEILPWMIGGQSLAKQWFVRLAFLYGIVGEFAAALRGWESAPRSWPRCRARHGRARRSSTC
jgi:hypothetical protein